MIGGVLGRIFGADKAGEAIINNASNAIDKVFYTKEEQAEDRAKAKTELLTVYMKWLESTSGSRIARRLLALGSFLIWAVEHAIATIFSVSAIWSANNAEMLLASAEIMREQAQSNNALVAVVFGFYFGGPVAVDVTKNLLTKWAEKGEVTK